MTKYLKILAEHYFIELMIRLRECKGYTTNEAIEILCIKVLILNKLFESMRDTELMVYTINLNGCYCKVFT